MSDLAGLDGVLPLLRCPGCARALDRDARQVRCAAGHSFDIARQGYLNLAVGARAGTADSAAMVGSRAAFLARGHYRPIADAVAAAVHDARTVVDIAGGTGYYLAAVLDVNAGRGICLDLSAPALRRAARVHPRAAAVGADAWRPLPLGDASVDAVLSIFGPRDPAEIERVLSPGGQLVTVVPESGHLGELIEPLAMVAIDPGKAERTAASFARFDTVERQLLRYPVRPARGEAYAIAAMGPSARHVADSDLRARAAALPDDLTVTVDVAVTTYRVPA